jgi:hypothetical protein
MFFHRIVIVAYAEPFKAGGKCFGAAARKVNTTKAVLEQRVSTEQKPRRLVVEASGARAMSSEMKRPQRTYAITLNK